MEDNRQRKIEAGRQKLAAYKKRKTGDKASDSELSSFSISDTSLSPLPENNNTKSPKAILDPDSGSSSIISEHIELSNSENDRSLHEIVIANIPVDNSPETSFKTIVPNNTSVISDSSIISLNALERFELQNNNILTEIIKHDSFDLSKTESLISNPLDDLSSITLKSERVSTKPSCVSEEVTGEKRRSSDEMSNHKEPIGAQLFVDVDSSNHSTISLGTSTTEYKQCDKVNLGTIEFQDLLSHRDDYINQLTEALQLVVEDRNNFKDQTDHFAHEIAALKEQLVQATAIIKKNNWNTSTTEPISRDISLPNISAQNDTDINFDFEDPEFNETLSSDEKLIVADMRKKINKYIQQKVDEFKSVYQSEMKILRDRLEYEKRNKMLAKKTEDSLSTLHSIENNLKSFDTDKDIEEAFNDTFTPDELGILADLRTKIYVFIQQRIQNNNEKYEVEFKILRDQFDTEKLLHEAEIDRLRQLLLNVKSGSGDITELRQELNEKHQKEMEELRTYFEQRCADIEKHYSEEIFSQQSRKLSDSSICSELESEVYPPPTGPGGDAPNIILDSNKDLNTLRLEVQNKYHAELEILREDYENRLDELKINHEKVVDDLEQKYLLEINVLKSDLEEAQKHMVATQEVASSGDFEIAEVVQSYEHRLQEQVMLAKIDIISALEQQIQTLVSSTGDNLEWPTELLQLRDRLTEHWHKEIQELKDQHREEITKLNEDHEKQLCRVLERERRNSLKSDEFDIKKDRDNLKKISSNLRHLVAELIKYFTECEDELNNTIVEELLKFNFDKDSTKLDSDLNDSGSDLDASVSPRVKRVHFTPDVSGIIKLINDTNFDLDNTKDLSIDFRTELDHCLGRLKSEANAILSLTSNLKSSDVEVKPATDDQITSLTRQLITETQRKNELTIELEQIKTYAAAIDAEKQTLEIQIEEMLAKQQVLCLELDRAKEKINDLVESGRKEIVSEGYGENDITGSTTLGGRIASLADLQEKARMVLADADPSMPLPLYHLVEELCREGDRIMDDAKRDHEDLVQQIEAADKKLRATTQFLEEQAVERELERDEAQKEVARLKEQIRDGERTRASCERITKEVEILEKKMVEMTQQLVSNQEQITATENELKEAIDKIWMLRDIIRTLEGQIEDKIKTELELRDIIAQNEIKLKHSRLENEELKEFSLENSCDVNKYVEVIRKLESDVQKLRVSSELIGPDGVSKQVKLQLNEFEKNIEKRTKELETLHIVSNTNCSSPSEDMSIRDQIRQQPSTDLDSDLPLEQLARLKDKLIRHARAEDAAMKHIRDLEMQLFTCKQGYDEMQSERDVLQEQLSVQMKDISSLQLRLDEQRLRAESAQSQTNTSLEHKIYELENLNKELLDGIHTRDKTIKQLNIIIEETKECMALQQRDLNLAADKKNQIVQQLEDEINRLKSDLDLIKSQSEIDLTQKNDTTSAVTPEFLDTILADKNADLDSLKNRLIQLQKELAFYDSLQLTKEQLVNYSNDTKRSDLTSEPDQMRRQELSFESITSGENLEFKRNQNETMFIGSTFRDSKLAKQHSPFTAPEISTIEKTGPGYQFDGQGDSLKSQKHVHFDENLEITRLSTKITDLQQEIESKNETLHNYESKLASFSDLVLDIKNLQKKLEFSEETLKDTTETYQEEIETMKDEEKNLRVELAEVKMLVQSRDEKLEALDKELGRKDQMYMNLAKDKRDLEQKFNELEIKFKEFKNYEDLMEERNKEIYELEKRLAETETIREEMIEKENTIEQLQREVDNLKVIVQDKNNQFEKLDSEYKRLKLEANEKDEQSLKMDKEFNNILSQYDELKGQIQQLKQILDDKNAVITQQKLELDQFRLDNAKLSLSQLELDLARCKKELVEKDLIIAQNKNAIDDLNKELHHSQNLIQEKDNNLEQLTIDSNNLHKNIESIQSKMLESGNVLELKKRLHDEQQLTLVLHEQLKYLKKSIEQYEYLDATNASNTLMLLKESAEKEKLLNQDLICTKEEMLLEIKYLKQQVAYKDDLINKLQKKLEEEKDNSNSIQLQDAEIIESMRVRLEGYLNHENETEKLLETEKAARKNLETIISTLENPTSVSLDSSYKINDQKFQNTCIRMNLLKVNTENEILNSELSRLKLLHSLVQKELIQAREKIDKQQAQLKQYNQAEKLHSGDKKHDKKLELELRSLEAENIKLLLTKYEDEKKMMSKQIEELMANLRGLKDREKELTQMLAIETNKQLDGTVPDSVLHKLREVSSIVEDHIRDNTQLKLRIEELTDDKRHLQSRVLELDERLHAKSHFDDPVARADHLFGRYLKSESYRKSLVFQKRYLIFLLASYQKTLPSNTNQFNFVLPEIRIKPLNKFRTAVYVIISIRRMQYIVQRWHTGKRIGASVVLKKPLVPQIIASTSSSAYTSGDPRDSRPLSSNSPPCRDRNSRKPLGNTIQESISLAPLQAPVLLSQYVERFENIQQKLGLAVNRSST